MELPKDANLNEIWKALGLMNQPAPNHDWVGRVSLFGAGLLVGAGIALLLTPPSAQEADEAESDGADQHA